MSVVSKRRETLVRLAEYAKYRMWRDGEDEYAAAELGALLWAIALIDELRDTGLYDRVASAAKTRIVRLRKVEVPDGRQ